VSQTPFYHPSDLNFWIAIVLSGVYGGSTFTLFPSLALAQKFAPALVNTTSPPLVWNQSSLSNHLYYSRPSKLVLVGADQEKILYIFTPFRLR
jgi:hypothetical protein